MIYALGTAKVLTYVDGTFDLKKDAFTCINPQFEKDFATKRYTAQIKYNDQVVSEEEEKRELVSFVISEGAHIVEIKNYQELLTMVFDVFSIKMRWWLSLTIDYRMNRDF